MELIISIEDKKKYNSFVQFFESLDIKIINKSDIFYRKKLEKANINTFVVNEKQGIKTNIRSKNSLDNVFGIWKGRNITLNKIREKQWGKRTG